jgi:surface antigen
MQIKTWQKVLFVGSIVAFVLYYKRDTLKKYFDFSKLTTFFANKWVGIKEIGFNKAFSNEVFQNMLKNVGWNSGEAWCMYFAKAIHFEVYKDKPQVQEKIKKILTGSTQQSFKNAQNDKTGTYTTTTSPKVGDIAIWQNKYDKSKGHAGVVEQVNRDTITTIEGNTGDRSVAEGDLVAKKQRPRAINQPLGSGSNLILRGYIRKLDNA